MFHTVGLALPTAKQPRPACRTLRSRGCLARAPEWRMLQLVWINLRSGRPLPCRHDAGEVRVDETVTTVTPGTRRAARSGRQPPCLKQPARVVPRREVDVDDLEFDDQDPGLRLPRPPDRVNEDIVGVYPQNVAATVTGGHRSHGAADLDHRSGQFGGPWRERGHPRARSA